MSPGSCDHATPACPGPWAWLFLLHDSTPNGRLDGEYIQRPLPSRIQDIFPDECQPPPNVRFLFRVAERLNEAGGMMNVDPVIMNLATALGIGLLIGGEREHRKVRVLQTAAGNSHVYLGLARRRNQHYRWKRAGLAITMIGVMALTALAIGAPTKTIPD